MKALQFSISVPQFAALKVLGSISQRLYYYGPLATVVLVYGFYLLLVHTFILYRGIKTASNAILKKSESYRLFSNHRP